MKRKKRPHNSTYPKGGDSCSIDSFVVNETLDFQIKFCGKSPALRVAANRYTYTLILLYPTLAVAYFLSVYSVL
jgi:hypothetical protein